MFSGLFKLKMPKPSKKDSAYWQAALTANKRRTRLRAIANLGRLGDRSAIPALLVLFDHPDPQFNAEVARALYNLLEPADLPQILPFLTAKHRRVRNYALNFLLELGSDAVPILLESLSHPKRRVRLGAAWSLGFLGAASAVPALIEVARQDTKPSVRQAAAHALDLLGATTLIH